MKNHTIAIFLAAYLLFLAAHAGHISAPSAPASSALEPAGTGPIYQLEPVSVTRTVCSEDKEDRELASCDYQLLTLSVVNLEALPPAEAEAAERITEAFNDRMTGMMDELDADGKAVGRDAKNAYKGGYLLETYYDEVSASGTVMGEVVSVRIDRSSYTGGAHPNGYASACLFDLTAGQFILDPSQLADDPTAFLTGAAEKLVEKAESIRKNRDVYWQDYAEIISRWNEGTVLFDEEGMLAVYSTYELGPYSMGEVELRLNWEELAELMGPGGLARLGIELPETVG